MSDANQRLVTLGTQPQDLADRQVSEVQTLTLARRLTAAANTTTRFPQELNLRVTRPKFTLCSRRKFRTRSPLVPFTEVMTAGELLPCSGEQTNNKSTLANLPCLDLHPGIRISDGYLKISSSPSNETLADCVQYVFFREPLPFPYQP